MNNAKKEALLELIQNEQYELCLKEMEILGINTADAKNSLLVLQRKQEMLAADSWRGPVMHDLMEDLRYLNDMFISLINTHFD